MNLVCPAPERPAFRTKNGILVLDKPEGITSFGVVSRVKRLLRVEKVGHCGTLDPFATGVLVVCLNQATRIAELFLDQNKTYRFTIYFGKETDTLDRTGQVTREYEGPPLSEEKILNALKPFRGSYVQRVPLYAAVRVKGRRLYEWARSGEKVDLPEREVSVHSLELHAFQWPEAVLEVHCSKGAYVRQLAADIGSVLGCGAHVSRLRRLASGPFHLDRALSLEELGEACIDGSLGERIIALNDALTHLPAFVIEEKEVLKKLQDGHLDSSWENRCHANLPAHKGPFRLVDGANELIALWQPHPVPGQSRRLRLFRW
jgi:tRNA pseudouridine55 synthase